MCTPERRRKKMKRKIKTQGGLWEALLDLLLGTAEAAAEAKKKGKKT